MTVDEALRKILRRIDLGQLDIMELLEPRLRAFKIGDEYHTMLMEQAKSFRRGADLRERMIVSGWVFELGMCAGREIEKEARQVSELERMVGLGKKPRKARERK